MDRAAVTGLELARQEGELAVDDHPRAHLEDVRGLAEEAGVLHHLGTPPARLDHHLDAGPVTGLERSRGEQGELALRGAEERRPFAEERAVEVCIYAANHY